MNMCCCVLCSPSNDQEELFDQIAEGRYEFTSPYWDDVSESAMVGGAFSVCLLVVDATGKNKSIKIYIILPTSYLSSLEIV